MWNSWATFWIRNHIPRVTMTETCPKYRMLMVFAEIKLKIIRPVTFFLLPGVSFTQDIARGQQLQGRQLEVMMFSNLEVFGPPKDEPYLKSLGSVTYLGEKKNLF